MFKIRAWSRQQLIVGAAIVAIVVAGLIHLVQGPEQYAEAAYVGILFYLNAAGAGVAAYGIYRSAKTWGWGLGMFVAGGAMVMYVVSRTVGLPGMDIQEWGEPIGLLSLIVEGLYLVLSVVYLRRNAASAPNILQTS